ncbi:hypothetical protein WA556_001340 [Blastocystis sp. ATCC 50177/Nand II]
MGTAKVASTSMRIAKRIARSGVCSRREAEELIRNGRVSLNGVIVTSPALNVTDQDEVCVDRRRLSPIQRTRVIVANKRAGELVTTKDERGRRTIFDRLRAAGIDGHIIPVGQLDYNTEGLLLLTNDGDYARYLEHPMNAIPRRYRAQVFGKWDDRRVAALQHPNVIDGKRYNGCIVKRSFDMEGNSATKNWCSVQVTEGKYHEVKILLGFVGLQVDKLIRTDFGAYTLGNLGPGEFREVRAISKERVGRIRPFEDCFVWRIVTIK